MTRKAKTKLKARVRLVVEVPFDFGCGEPDESGHAESRVAAAQHAESVLVAKLSNALKGRGEVVSTLVEEVTEA